MLTIARQYSHKMNTMSHSCCPHIRMWPFCRWMQRIAMKMVIAAVRCAMKLSKTVIKMAYSQLIVTVALLQHGKHNFYWKISIACVVPFGEHKYSCFSSEYFNMMYDFIFLFISYEYVCLYVRLFCTHFMQQSKQ